MSASSSTDASGSGGESQPTTARVALPPGVALHARPAAELVRAAGRLPVVVTVTAHGKQANAKSVLQVLGLGATGGTELTLSANGVGAEEAVKALVGVIAGLRA